MNTLRAITEWLALATLFALALTSSPDFFSNQHQYLLHGLAAGGRGHLGDDWLANTADPTPLFSLAVGLLYRTLGLWPLWVAFALLAGTYLDALRRLARPYLREGAEAAFVALIFLTHSALPRWAAAAATGVDLPWFLQAGLAGQYVLGTGIQPSMFGVLLLQALVAGRDDKPYRAALWVAAACALHATYLLPGALIVLALLVREWRGRGAWATLKLAAFALLPVLPVVAYGATLFPTGAAAEATDIVATRRIPHHCVTQVWFDGYAAAQLAWLGLGGGAIRRDRLFLLVALPTVLATTLSLVQALALEGRSHTLSLLFPWRLSAVLIPLATAVLLARVTPPLGRRGTFAVMLVLAIAGSWVVGTNRGYRVVEAEKPLLAWVRDNLGPGTTVLIPAQAATVAKPHSGNFSNTFTPPPRLLNTGGANPTIAVDLQGFRLTTGVPIWVDYKSIPYRADEVLEWSRRLAFVGEVYRAADWDAAGLTAELRRRGVTHAVVRADAFPSRSSAAVYADSLYRVLRLSGPPAR